MGIPAVPKPVRFFAGLLTGRLDILPRIYEAMEERLGPIDYTSELIEFNFTNYYEQELGPGLKRQFLSFQNLVSPDKLVEIKLFTNELEQKWSEEGKRLLNIDPGYLNDSRVVLASTKDFSHRIYMGQGIYAEITLLFRHKQFEPLPWTYPDFRDPAYQQVFKALRLKYMEQVKVRQDSQSP